MRLEIQFSFKLVYFLMRQAEGNKDEKWKGNKVENREDVSLKNK